jgi:oxygen-independent coproporphyrinogen-3 oxidase
MAITRLAEASCEEGCPAALPAVERASDADAQVWTQALRRLRRHSDDALALALHLPFCAMRCGYCSSDVGITTDGREVDAYLDALLRQMDRVVASAGRDREVVQVHVGGGTPNLLADAQLERMVAGLRARFRLLPETEWSIECDPRRCSAGQFDTLRRLGFQHLHLGMADLDADVQRACGRIQSATVMADVVAMARHARFDTVQLDLVRGLPRQTEASWQATLAGVLALGVDRVRCMRYRHRPAQAWNQFSIASDALPTGLNCEALGHRAARTLTDAGYVWVGPDLFVLDDDPLARAASRGELRRSRIGLTAQPVDHVLGFGPGQVSEVLDTIAFGEPSRAAWQQQASAGEWPLVSARRRSVAERLARRAVEHLQTRLELPLKQAPLALEASYARLAALEPLGWIAIEADRLHVTPQGRFHLEQLCEIVEHDGVSRGPAERHAPLH